MNRFLLIGLFVSFGFGFQLMPNSISGNAFAEDKDGEPECQYYLNYPHFYWGTKVVNSTIEGAVWNQNQGEGARCGNHHVASCEADGYTYWRGQYFGDGRMRFEICRKKITVPDNSACTPMPGSKICQANETLLQDKVHHQATHNAQGQKAVQNQYGIFVSYAELVYNDPDENSTSSWIVARSQDNGATFKPVFSTSMHRTLPPPVIADTDGNIYSIHGTGFKWEGTPPAPKNAWFYQFFPGNEFASPTITKIKYGSTDKHDLVFDRKIGRFYYMTFNDTFADAWPIPNFFVLETDGDVNYSTAMSRSLSLDGKYAKVMYPHLAVDGQRIIAAWSTEYDPPGASDPDDPNQTNLYRNVSFVYSDDYGQKWRNFSGNQVNTPMVMDESGPSTTVTQPDEIGDHNWLGGIGYVGNRLYVAHEVWGKLHPGSHPHFTAFDFSKRTREFDTRYWNGATTSPDGTGTFITNRDNPDGPIYYASGGNYKGKSVLTILISEDKGKTWRDYAVGSYHSGDPEYTNLVSASENVTPDGHIIGVYTRCNPRPEIGRCESYMNGHYILDSRVYFFRVKAK